MPQVICFARLARLARVVTFTGLVFGIALLACTDLILPSDLVDAGDAGEAGIVVDCNAEDAGHPIHLQCTGLYGDWESKTISPDARPFDPGLHLWSDGADKLRWIYLPPGAQIDATDPNEWVFPVGTKIWKEFRLLGKRIETRLLWKISPLHWFRTTYEWNDAETLATEITLGRLSAAGLGYVIPPADQCATCHQGRRDFVLGLEIVSMSSPAATGLRMSDLRAANLIANAPPNEPVIPGDPTAQAALGYLHANCGNACHSLSPRAFAATSGLFMRLEVDATGALPAAAIDTATYRTAVNVASAFVPITEPPGSFMRVRPRDVAHSAIHWRDSRRDADQMPPLATRLVDQEGLKLLDAWINSL